FHVTGVQTCALPIYQRNQHPDFKSLSNGYETVKILVAVVPHPEIDQGEQHDHRRVANNVIAFEIRVSVHHVDHKDHICTQNGPDDQSENQYVSFHTFGCLNYTAKVPSARQRMFIL